MPGPWQHRCPEGHADYAVRTSRGVIHCRPCGRDYPVKRDMRTGELVDV